jgi:prostaglandin-endoperoxide synthase 2
MSSFLESFALEALSAIIGHDDANAFLINRLVKAGRGRPHPWSTKHDYISWSGLTDRTYNARLLPANPYPAAEARGTRRPPVADLVPLMVAPKGKQVMDRKSTGLFPAFAQYLTDGFIRTHVFNKPRPEERKRTTSNHEIDMSPLYGRTEAQTKVLRVQNPGPGLKGQLRTEQLPGGHIMPPRLFGADGKPRADFCDANGQLILDEPLGVHNVTDRSTLFAVGGDRANANPQVAMLNLLFLREHNRLAALLEAANPGWNDDRVFETARNIIIVMFIKVVVEEYINHINTSVFKFAADPKVAWDADWNRPNWMTAEFSLLYRWHPLATEMVQWGGADIGAERLSLNNSVLITNGLADAMVQVSANRVGRMHMGNSPWFLAEVEKKAIEQGRLNNIDTYNAYCVAMDMKPAKDFADLVGKTDEPVEKARRAKLAADLKALYGTVDNVEFYVGLFAEPPNDNGPLPDLILAMVAMDAFSQALTNPLLSKFIWGDTLARDRDRRTQSNRQLAFTDIGLAAIEDTKRLRDILVRNSTNVGDRFVGMTRADWRRV